MSITAQETRCAVRIAMCRPYLEIRHLGRPYRERRNLGRPCKGGRYLGDVIWETSFGRRFEGAFVKAYRDGDSTWAVAEAIEELPVAQAMIRKLQVMDPPLR